MLTYFYVLFLSVFVAISSMKIKTSSLKSRASEEISDQELDELLKDPKYAALAGGLNLTLTSDDTKPIKEQKSSIKHNKKESFTNIDLLSKSLGVGENDPLKEINILDASKDEEKKQKSETENEKSKKDDHFTQFDFLTKQQAKALLEVLREPVFFNILPHEAQVIVKVS
jgi:hypothetical protein